MLQALVGRLMSTPLEFSRPLWQYYLVDNSGCAIICRLHHCIADGLALVQVLLSMTDAEPDTPWPDLSQPQERRLGRLAGLLVPAVKLAKTAIHHQPDTATP